MVSIRVVAFTLMLGLMLSPIPSFPVKPYSHLSPISGLSSSGTSVSSDGILQTLQTLLSQARSFSRSNVWGNVAALIAQLKTLSGSLFQAYNDTRGLPEKPVSEAEKELGELYFSGQIKTSPFSDDFRPSRQEDVTLVTELSQEERNRYKLRALQTLRSGKGVFGFMAGGASSRMNVKDAPEEALELAKAMVTEKDPDIQSKGAVPIGKSPDGRTFSFLGALMTNVTNLQQQISAAIGNETVRNNVMVFTNNNYRDELNSELAIHGNYGIPTEDILIYHQTLGRQFYANFEDIEKLEKKSGTAYPKARAKAEEIAEALEEGSSEAVIMPEEKSPLGHGDFVHHMISSGLIKELIRRDVQWISTRNIDNSAATYDEDWLVTLGMFMEKGLDMQMEVSARKPGQKGGGLYVMSDGTHVLNEDPAVAASLEKFLAEQAEKGYEQVDLSGFTLSDLIQEDETVTLESYQMRYDGNKSVTRDEFAALLEAGNILVFKKDGAFYFYEKATSQDSYWFNDAVAIFNLRYLWSIYGTNEQTFEAFKTEILGADADQLEAIAERGRRKFPTLIDPKPAKTEEGMVAIKRETNFWQGTSVADRDKIKIEAVGVVALRNIEEEYQKALEENDRETIIALITHLRMLATKKWEGEVESYFSNKPYIDAILRHITEGDLVLAESLTEEQLQSVREIESARGEVPEEELDRLRVLSQLLQNYIRHLRSQEDVTDDAATGVAQSI